MAKFAVIETGGKQYKVALGERVRIEKLPAEEGEQFAFDKVLLLVNDDEVQIGTPYIAGAHVEGRVVKQMRDKKKIVFKFHSKTRYRKKKGHRQHLSEVEVIRI
jgi:large subunit ribosomal protein L21